MHDDDSVQHGHPFINLFTEELATRQQRGERVKKMMAYRRQLELRREVQQLARETCEFDFSALDYSVMAKPSSRSRAIL